MLGLGKNLMRELFTRFCRMRGAVMAPLLGAIALAGGGAGIGYMTAMPGQSFRGPLPPLSAEEEQLARRIDERLAPRRGRVVEGGRTIWYHFD